MFSEDHLFDIIKAGANKGNAMQMLLKRKKLENLHVIGVGDNDNDIELIRLADTGMAVGNAGRKAKQEAKIILEPNSSPCIPQILAWLDRVLGS